MAEHDVVAVLDVMRTDPDSGEEGRVGQVEYSEAGQLAIVDVQPDYHDALQAAIDAVNRKDRISELIPSESNERSLGARSIKRGEDGFLAALSGYMQRYYRFSLV